MTAAPSALRADHLDEALGLLTAPRLSWQLPTGAAVQQAYRITTDHWDSGWVEDARSILVPWTGPALESSRRVHWRVQVRTDLGVSEPSPAAWFETGLLRPEDWQATWVGPAALPDGLAGERAAAFLRAEFTVTAPVVSARLHITAHGIYEARLNGHRVGDAELTPGYTQYVDHLQVQTYDVTSSILAGANAIAVVVSDGWFRGQVGLMRADRQWGDQLAVLAQVNLEHPDGTTTIVGTGPDWRSGTGHVLAADLIAGERWDLTQRPDGWDTAGFDQHGWAPAVCTDPAPARLVHSPAPPVRRVEELAPRSVRRLPTGVQVVDLGQNINGWTRLLDLGPAGTTTNLVHGEWLGADGDVTTANLEPDLPFLPHPLAAGQVDAVTSIGADGDVFEPRRTTHGFQYVRVEGHPHDLTVDDLRGVVVHTDMRRTGWFSCSDERLNRFHEAAVWSFRGNACDIPTDCPHRERHGWTGDWQVYVPTAAFLYDVAGLTIKWLRDVAADQWPDGTVANISPTPPVEGRHGPVAGMHGSAGWGDAAVIVPWETYRAYGDTDVLEQMWPTMVAWLDRTERLASSGRHPDRAAARPEPAAHEQHLWDTGFHFGEWLEPGAGPPTDLHAFSAADKGDVATAYFARSATLMARIATVLGKRDAADRYAALADAVADAWRAEYVDAAGRLVPDTQANHVRALTFDLVPPHQRPAVANRLVQLVQEAGGHLGTGFLSTPDLLPALAAAGHLDTAYQLLLSDGEPSWLGMVDRGATTVWEHWDGVDAAGVPRDSLNHYSKGAVISFLHRWTAGIQAVEPGYRRLRIHPHPGGGLTRAEARLDSPYGRIRSAWHLHDEQFELQVDLPPGTSAEVVLPDGTTREAAPGSHTYSCAHPST